MRNIRSFLLLLALSASIFHLEAQTFSWAKQFIPPGGFYGHLTAIDAGGNYCIGGPNQILKISPTGTQVWARQLQGVSIYSFTLDGNGNAIAGGFFQGTVDFDPGPGTFNLTSAGHEDAFVVKLDGNGNFLWAISVGSIGQDRGIDVSSDASGIYLSGDFGNYGAANPGLLADFDPGPGLYEVQSNGQLDRFLLKLDANGSFVWVRTSGGTLHDRGFLLTTDPAGNIFQLHFVDNASFIDKWDSDGNLLWSKETRGAGKCCLDITDITTDGNGNIVMGGYFSGTVDFDPGPGVFNVVGPDGQDGFAWKLSNDGNLIWAKAILGGYSNPVNGIAADQYGNVYSSGFFSGTGNHDFDPGPGTYNLSCGTTHDMFIQKLNADGNFRWAIQVGGGNNTGARGYGIEVNVQGQVYSAVSFSGSVDFDPAKPKYNLSGSNAFAILKLNQPNNGASRYIVDAPQDPAEPLSLFPNPTRGSFQFRQPDNASGSAVITVVDLMGRVMLKQTITAEPLVPVSLDISHLDAGTYIVQFATRETMMKTKLIKLSQ